MDDHTVLAPTPAIVAAADALYESVGRFFAARMAGRAELTKYESHTEAYNLLSLAGRHIEALAELARRDMVLLPAANSLARAVLEAAVRAIWLLQPDDVFEREGRYLSHLQEEEHVLRRQSNLIQ